jgi:hypothetical protein
VYEPEKIFQLSFIYKRNFIHRDKTKRDEKMTKLKANVKITGFDGSL